MGKYITLLGGIISVVIGICGIASWWWDFVAFLKASVSILLVLGGLAAFFAGISEIKDSIRSKKDKKKA